MIRENLLGVIFFFQAGWVYHSDECYLIPYLKFSYERAAQYCNENFLYSYMVKPKTEKQNQFLKYRARGKSYTGFARTTDPSSASGKIGYLNVNKMNLTGEKIFILVFEN